MKQSQSIGRRLLPALLLLLLGAGAIVACKQGEGGRCQVDADCEDGFVCNQGTDPPSCQKPGGSGQLDGSVPDADPDGPTDATDATDAETDAETDAAVN